MFVVSNFEFTLYSLWICHLLPRNMSHSRLGVGLVTKPSPRKTGFVRNIMVFHTSSSWVFSIYGTCSKKTYTQHGWPIHPPWMNGPSIPSMDQWEILRWRPGRRSAGRRPLWCPATPPPSLPSRLAGLGRRRRHRLGHGEAATNRRHTWEVVHHRAAHSWVGFVIHITEVLYGRYVLWYYIIWYVMICDMIWYLIWEMIWYGMIWYDDMNHIIQLEFNHIYTCRNGRFSKPIGKTLCKYAKDGIYGDQQT